jgi:K+ transporter
MMARKRMKKFSALVGTIVVTTMLTIYFLALPTFFASSIGKVFSIAWLIVALVTLAGFGLKVFKRKQKKRTFAPARVQEASVHTLAEWQKRQRQKVSSH